MKLPLIIHGNSIFMKIGIVLSVFLWATVLFLYFNGSGEPRVFWMVFIGIPIYWTWSRFVRLILSHEGVTFYPGFFREFQLHWEDIDTVNMGLEMYGTKGEKILTLNSSNPSKKKIRINYTYFRRVDLFLVLQELFSRNPKVQINKETLEYFQRSKKAFEKVHAA